MYLKSLYTIQCLFGLCFLLLFGRCLLGVPIYGDYVPSPVEYLLLSNNNWSSLFLAVPSVVRENLTWSASRPKDFFHLEYLLSQMEIRGNKTKTTERNPIKMENEFSYKFYKFIHMISSIREDPESLIFLRMCSSVCACLILGNCSNRNFVKLDSDGSMFVCCQ